MKARVIYKNQETPDTISIRYEPDEPMPRKAGQWIIMKLDVEQEGKTKPISRPYSLSSSSTASYLETAVKREPKGLGSNRIHAMSPGDEIEIKGPYGEFTFEKGESDEVVLIGAGSGITPLMSILRSIKEEGTDTLATLIYSNKTPEDIVYRKELEALGKDDNINCHFTITRPGDLGSQEWDGLTGRVNLEMIKEKVKDINNPLFYICGPPQFVEALKVALLQDGVPKEHIKQEKYGSNDA